MVLELARPLTPHVDAILSEFGQLAAWWATTAWWHAWAVGLIILFLQVVVIKALSSKDDSSVRRIAREEVEELRKMRTL